MSSRWFYILIANIVVLSANIWLFTDKEPAVVEHQLTEQLPIAALPTAEPIYKASQSSASTDSFHFSFYDPFAQEYEDLAPLLEASNATIEQKNKEIIKVQKVNAQRVSQLERLVEENRKLQLQLSKLTSTLSDQASVLIANEKTIKSLEASKQKQAFQTDIEFVKKSIDSQPDLLKGRPIKKEVISETSELEKETLSDELSLALEKVEEEKEVPRLSGSVEFGFMYEQDNQETKGVNGRLILDYDDTERYHVNSDLDFEFEREDGDMSTDKYRWQLQADYNLDTKNLLFARSDISRSKFSSYEQEDIFTVGYGRILFNTEKHKFNLEIGPGYRFAIPNAGESALSVDEFIVRTRFNYERIINDNLQVKMDAVLEKGNSNSVHGLNFKAQNRIYQELYIIFDFSYKYTQRVPVDTVNKEVSSGLSLLYAF